MSYLSDLTAWLIKEKIILESSTCISRNDTEEELEWHFLELREAVAFLTTFWNDNKQISCVRGKFNRNGSQSATLKGKFQFIRREEFNPETPFWRKSMLAFRNQISKPPLSDSPFSSGNSTPIANLPKLRDNISADEVHEGKLV